MYVCLISCMNMLFHMTTQSLHNNLWREIRMVLGHYKKKKIEIQKFLRAKEKKYNDIRIGNIVKKKKINKISAALYTNK